MNKTCSNLMGAESKQHCILCHYICHKCCDANPGLDQLLYPSLTLTELLNTSDFSEVQSQHITYSCCLTNVLHTHDHPCVDGRIVPRTRKPSCEGT